MTEAPTGPRTSPPGLHRLARLHGIQTRYRDLAGEWQTARPEALRAVLAALGVEADKPSGIEDRIRARREELGARGLDPATPVTLEDDGDPPGVELRLPASGGDGEVECRLRTEDGRLLEWKARPEAVGSDEPAPDGRAAARIRLPRRVPTGYHRLEAETGDGTARTLVLAAPPATWRPDDGDGPREWGVFLPLHALRSEESWGTGDVDDLERLLEWTARLGGDVVGTLPLLAGAEKDAADARVYSPVSRLFWNEVYLDPETAPGLEASDEARRVLESVGFRERIRELRRRDLVDWRGAVEAKRAVLEPLARDYLRDGAPAEVRSFLEARPEAEAYARFRARWEVRDEPWGRWPASLRDPPLEAREGEEASFRYHVYVQWLAERQMRRLSRDRGPGRAGLYLDLPLGADPDGFDVWRHRDLFARDVAVGSPPDDFFSEGQNWGFPPIRPDVAARSGFAYTVASLRQSMRFAARLRVDHVMGLHRLFWIPRGMPARHGVYVRYPHEALYAALCIESHRHRTAVVGEDLGTVPGEVRTAMDRHRVERMYVAQFAARADADPVLPAPPRRSVASLNTHDTATFAGFWQGADIDVRVEMDLLEADEAAGERAAREELRDAWSRFLRAEGDLPADADPGAPGPVLRGSLRRLARSRASLLLVNLEDLWLEERPQNVPGSGPERPNFRRKARLSLEEITGRERIAEPLREVDRLRRGDAGPAAAGRTGASARDDETFGARDAPET